MYVFVNIKPPPFANPARNLVTRAIGRLTVSPNNKQHKPFPNMVIRITGLRPILSDSQPQKKLKANIEIRLLIFCLITLPIFL